MTDQPPTEQQTAVGRIPIAHSVVYAVRGLPEITDEYNPARTIAPTEITLTYRAAPDSHLGRVTAYVKGWWMEGEARIPTDKPVGRHLYGSVEAWPVWLAEEARLHDPAAETERLRARVAELEVGLNDLAALVSQWHGRAKKAEAALDDVRRLVRRLAAHAVGFQDVLDESDRGPWGRTVGADIAELSAAVAPDAASEVTSAPLRPVHASSVSESAQSPTGTPEGAVRASGAEQRDRRERYATAIHDAMEPDLSLVDQEPACQALFARAAEAAVALADTEATEGLASADNPTHLRWGLNDVPWSDDGSAIVLLSGPDREAYWLELDPERAAVLREDLAGPAEEPVPAEEFTGTQPCGHDDYHDPHPWHGRPDLWCPGIGYDDAAEEQQ